MGRSYGFLYSFFDIELSFFEFVGGGIFLFKFFESFGNFRFNGSMSFLFDFYRKFRGGDGLFV